MPVVGFKRGESVKDFLVKGKVPLEKQADGKYCNSQETRCKVCIFPEEKKHFYLRRG